MLNTDFEDIFDTNYFKLKIKIVVQVHIYRAQVFWMKINWNMNTFLKQIMAVMYVCASVQFGEDMN